MTRIPLHTIVVLNDNARITGGADKIALASACGLARRGYAVHLLTAVGPVSPELLQIPGLQVTCTDQFDILHDPKRSRAAVQGLWNIKSGRTAGHLFDTLSPENTIVHLHLWAKALSSSVVRAAVDRGFRVVCTLHDYMLACPVGTLFNHPRQSICTLRPMSGDCMAANCDSRSYRDKLWRVARKAIQSSAGRLPAGLADIIAISDLVSSVMKPYLPAAARVHRLSNFVDVSQQEPARVENNQQFAFVGRLVPEKGPLLFAQAARAEKLGSMFLGEGPCREEIKAILPDAEISGWLPYGETFKRLRQARALVFPSRWYEAQPLVVLEAIAHGIPCVVADTSAAREMIVNGETGLLFRGGDVSDLRRKLAMLLDPSFAASLGRNAYDAYWVEPLTLDRHLDGLIQIYAQMLEAIPAQVVI
jgi:glycosyltransferase involved in cell wall biosynthesis